MKTNSKRTLHLETLENRMMLSAAPLALNAVQPAGTLAVYGIETAELGAGESTSFELSVADVNSITVLCMNHGDGYAQVSVGGTLASFQGNWLKQSINVSSMDTTTIQLENQSNAASNYTIYIVSNSAIETEMKGGVTNDRIDDTPQTLAFSNVSTVASTTSARQAVVLGTLGASDSADTYRITSNGGKLNAQLYSLSGSGFTMELYNAQQNLLACSTSVDDFTSVLSSVASASNETYYIRVLPSEGAALSETFNYTLTVTESCAVETNTSSSLGLINVLDASGVGVGNVSGKNTVVSESSCTFAGETIRSMAVDGTHMATVSYVKSGSAYVSATVRLLESAGSSWETVSTFTLTAQDASEAGWNLSDFGTSISIFGTNILLGASGTNTALFLTPNGSQFDVSKLSAASVSAGDAFGSSVLLSENFAFVAASSSAVGGTNSGAVYVFKKGISGWNLCTTLSDASGASASRFGSKLAWDAVSQRLYVASAASNTLNIFQYSDAASAWTLHSTLNGTSNPSEVGSSVTNFGRAIAAEGNTLAVSCKVNSSACVRLYTWNSTSSTWNFVQELSAPADISGVTEFGTSLSISGIQLAVSSTTALNSDLENTGIVCVYRGTASEGTMSWELIQTFQHSEEGAFGKIVSLSANQMSVLDGIQNRIYTLSNFADVDVWKLNVTDAAAPVTFTLNVRTAGESVPNFEITGPDGASVSVTKETAAITGKTSYSFTPTAAGTYTFRLYSSDENGASYVLNVTSGTYANVIDTGTVQPATDLSNLIVVEYAQQILASGAADAAATLGGKKLDFVKILDGNKVVWNVTDRLANGTYELAISGLEAVTGDSIPTLNVSYEYSGTIFVDFEPTGPTGTKILKGSASSSFQSAGETLVFAIPTEGAALTDLQYAFKTSDPEMTLTTLDPVYDAENACWIVEVSSTKAGNVTLDAVFYAALDAEQLTFSTSETLREAATVGTLDAGGEKTFSVTLAAGKTMNFALTDDAGNALTFELYSSDGTRLAVGSVDAEGSANGQRIQSLKNTSESETIYTLKITNPTQISVDFTLVALSGAQLESEGNNSFLESNVLSGGMVGTVTSNSKISLTDLDSSTLTSSQLESFGTAAQISGDYAFVSGSSFVTLYHMEGRIWVRMQTLDAGGTLYDAALDGSTLVLGVSEAVKIYSRTKDSSTGIESWTLSATLTIPETISGVDTAAASNLFGYSVALKDGTLAVSAPAANDSANLYNNCGCVFLYTFDSAAGTWKFSQQLSSSYQSILYHFGYEVALSENTMAIYARSNSATDKGLLTLWVRSNGVWVESAQFETATSYEYFLNPQIQVADGRVVFCCSSTGTIYQYDWNGSGWTAAAALQTGIRISAISLSEDGLRLAVAGTSSDGTTTTSHLAEFLSASTGWTQVSGLQTTGTASVLACDGSASLAVLRASVKNEDGTSAATASLVQWAPVYDADVFRFVASSNSAQISAVLEDGTDVSSAVTLYDASGNSVSASALTVGETYYIAVLPKDSNSTMRYILRADAASEPLPTAVCTPENGTVTNTTQNSVFLQFSENIDLSSLSASSVLSITNSDASKTLTAANFRIVDGACVEFLFDEALTDGVWSVTLAENKIFDLSGTAFTLSETHITIDTVPAEVTNIAVDSTAGTIIVTFSETVANANVVLTGKYSGNVDFTEGKFDGNVLTLSFDAAALASDFYTFQVQKIFDSAGNQTTPSTASELESASKTFGVTAKEGSFVTVSDSAWDRSTMDGAFAYVTTVSGFATKNAPIVFKPENIQEGEKISFRYENGTSVSDTISAVWDAASGCITVSTTSEDGTAFSLQILRNTTFEGATGTNGTTVLEFAEIVTLGDAAKTTIRQTSASGNIAIQGESDVYRFTLSGKSTVSAMVSSGTRSQFGLELYEILSDGTTLFIASSASGGTEDVDTVDALIDFAVNSSTAEKTYLLKVLGTKGTGGYRLVVTENAVFNGITNGSAQDAVTLLDTNKAVGHVSQEASALLATYARDALNGYSVAAEGRYLYIGVPGDSSKGESAGKVVVYEFNGITYDKISEISASDTDAGDAFGTSMVLNGDSLAISAPSCVNSNGTTGAMYIFARGEDGTWVQSLKITNPTSNTDFGLTMDYCGDILVVGTQNVSSYTYAFRISGTSYQMFNLTLIVSYLNQSSAEWSYYGQSVATDGTYIVVGAPLVDSIRVGTETISSAGMFFIYKVTETGVSLYSYATSEQNDLRLGYSVTAEDGLIAAAAVRSGDEDGMLSIYTTNMGSIDTVTKIDGITLSTLYSRTLKLKDGVLTLAGYSAENSAYTYTLGADGTWKQKDSCTSPSTSNKMFGFDTVRADSTIYVSDPASFLSGNLSVGVVYAFDNQDDYYRMTASGTTISVTFSDGTGLNDGKAVAGETIFAELFDSAGNLLSDGTAELADGVYKFNVTDGVEYVLKVRAAEGKACDYCVSVDGIVQTSRFVNLLDCSVSTPSGVGGVILAERPTSITLTLSEAVRADRISKESVQIFNGAEFISAESFTLSADGKTATFQFADSIVFYTSNLKYEIQTNDFCTVSGSTLSLENASAETGIAVYQQEISTVSVTQKLKAAEESTVLTWKFSEAVVEPSGGWSDAVTVSSTRNGVTTDVTANGTFSYTNNILTWSASADHYAQTDDVLTTKMDASKLLTASGVPLANLTQTADGFFLEASFTVNLNSSAETEIVIRKKSSISDVDAETASAAEVPANEAWVHEWNTIWVEVWGWVLSANNNGISTFTAEIAYDAALFTPFDAGGKLTFNWNSSAFDSVTVTAGESENTLRVTATTSRGDIGICGDGTLDGHTLVASIRFTQGTTRGGVAETFENGNVKPAKIGIGFVENSISIEDTSGITIEGNAEDVTDGLPTVYPVVYDLDNNGSITISDLIIFAKNYFKDTTSSTVTKCCDFDGNGTVTISDLILFAKNYFRSGDSVVMSTSLTSSWGVESEESPNVAAILPESESPNEITAILPQTYKTGVVLEDAGQIGNVFWRNTSAALCFAAPESTESEASETADLSGSVVDAAISELQFLDENENDEDEDDTINAILDVKLGTGLNFS